jgi:aconitate hydratase
MSVENRATIANMAPEYGATCGFFPVDEQTLDFLTRTGREPELVAAVEAYAKLQGLWRDDAAPIEYTEVIELDMSTVQPCLAGPARPQDRVVLARQREQVKTFGGERYTSTELDVLGPQVTLLIARAVQGVDAEPHEHRLQMRT